MYVPPAFKIDYLAKLHALMRAHSFATLVTGANETLTATHIPILLDASRGPFGTLVGHVAKANLHWEALRGAGEALVIFQGPHAYISPSWYTSPVAVPTWNYVAVHAYGRPQLIDDPQRVREILVETVKTYESAFEKQWRVEMAGDYVEKLAAQIVAFEIELTRIEGKAKLNQNRSLADRQKVIESLERNDNPGDRDVAKLMRESLPDDATPKAGA